MSIAFVGQRGLEFSDGRELLVRVVGEADSTVLLSHWIFLTRRLHAIRLDFVLFLETAADVRCQD